MNVKCEKLNLNFKFVKLKQEMYEEWKTLKGKYINKKNLI